jgi:hypothetical protein
MFSAFFPRARCHAPGRLFPHQQPDQRQHSNRRRPSYADGSSPVAKTGTVSKDAAGDLLVIHPI